MVGRGKSIRYYVLLLICVVEFEMFRFRVYFVTVVWLVILFCILIEEGKRFLGEGRGGGKEIW